VLVQQAQATLPHAEGLVVLWLSMIESLRGTAGLLRLFLVHIVILLMGLPWCMSLLEGVVGDACSVWVT
jgi:hypothetical protein